jgi:hypothetical protein
MCDLCERKRITRWFYEDEVVWIARCKTHEDKLIIVLKEHAPLPTPTEYQHMWELSKRFRPDSGWRLPNSIRDHWHIHEE